MMNITATYCSLKFVSLSIVASYYFLVTSFVLIGSRSVLTFAQTNETTTTTEQFPVSTSLASSSSSGGGGGLLAQRIYQPQSTTGKPTTADLNNQPTASTFVQQPAKSLKFTLIAGKIWKFNIKANSFSSRKEGELRLHKNVSINNYIIDDEGWFQYNPQQQQLFAWPSLNTRPGLYQFVLLPSEVDIEANSENNVANNLDVVANIVVELMRPLYLGNDYKLDIDQYIDHRFSLEYLHRHSSYPLLLHQIVSVFDTISTKQSTNSTNNISSPTNDQQKRDTITNSTRPAVTVSGQQQKGLLKLTNKLAEYLLINSSYSFDGDLFSLTWSTHPSIAANNTITPINECRVGTINETVSRLSSLSSGHRSDGEKFVIYYTINGPAQLINAQAIVPTDRGNHALKLNLNGPCQRASIIEELGIVTTTPTSNDNKLKGMVVADSDDKENKNINNNDDSSSNNDNNAEIQQMPNLTKIQPDPPSGSAPSPGLPYPEAIDSDTAVQTQAVTAPTKFPQSTTTTTLAPPTLVTNQTLVPFVALNDSQNSQSSTRAATAAILVAETTSTEAALSDPTPTLNPTESNVNNTTTTTTTTKLEAQVFKSEIQSVFQQQHQPKLQPQAKSFANFLDSTAPASTIFSNFTMPSTSTTTTSATPFTIATNDNMTTVAPPPSSLSIMSNMSRTLNNNTSSNKSISISSTTNDVNQAQESTLNEDFMGILNEVMDYLVSVAVPISIIVGTILLISITIALCHLCVKKRKSKQFKVKNRFSFRYGSERRAFLKNSSKPVILEADQKSISMGGTPQHQFAKKDSKAKKTKSTDERNSRTPSHILMHIFSQSGGDGQQDCGGGDGGGGGGCD